MRQPWLGRWLAQNNPPEVTPIKDLREHDEGAGCWCKPSMEDGVIVHNALDGREKHEVWTVGPN